MQLSCYNRPPRVPAATGATGHPSHSGEIYNNLAKADNIRFQRNSIRMYLDDLWVKSISGERVKPSTETDMWAYAGGEVESAK